ncbi:CRISPR-associated protein Cas9 [Staphylococcus microti]|uniref:CRISPR-associated endonuclease Cas9 n=1 Tax=Staphylococcus microti TaxID=569857 RepID=A0A0D6XNZ8_9STAP|nr:type II CRISPR RNA-guided endonuclease Cas9 [Staphylococcus microti]KIX89971.1 CRISPR-associated protein Cas9 [Staphylococcus microti]PNZ82374.1 type II CRISPR RNA-guided endonuclease Cas9 [Staphylococcus microti]SUM57369.1 CRISPR-associated protein, Csn1 family [Staphylococcus microti]
MEKDYILGLDIGIGSVGYGLIDYDTKSIIDAGVRLFPEANADNNLGRRAKRGARRLKRRRIHRLERVKSLLSEYKIISGLAPTNNQPYNIRVKGLTEQLTKDELAVALLHIAKRRGIHNVDVAADKEETASDSLSTKDQINKNAKFLESRYVCELQKERLENEGHVRGVENRFLTKDIVREAKKIIDTQMQYYPEIDETFKEKYISLVETRREYYEGPGKGSPYGWDADVKKWYQLMMGHCTYFPVEFRSVKYAYTADLYNALNDLNNLTIARDDNPKLEYHEKYHIIENVFKQKRNPTLKQIAKEIGVNDINISGYRVTKSGKPQFTSFKLFHDLKKVVKDHAILDDIDLLNQIAEILTIYQDKDSIVAELGQLEYLMSEADKQSISELTGYTGTHSLSLKCMNMIIDELWHSSMNQMEVFTYLNMRPKKYELKGYQRIPTDMIDDAILSPVVKRSFKQAIGVVNAIIKKYGLPKDIIIELARESNSAEKSRYLRAIQKKNEKTRERIEAIIKEYGNENAKGLVQKIKLHDAQEGKCLYSLKDIPLEDLLRNPNNYDIDHIIPRSVSFDDSMHNKVLVRREQNAKKNNQTPYQYLTSGYADIKYSVFKQHVLNLAENKDRMTKKKREYLLEERNINKYDVQKEFINRNLVDTRYTTRELTTLLKTYFTINNLDVKVKTINGSFTDFLRKRWGFKKNRDEGYKHHAEDALIIANADYLFKEHKLLKEIKDVSDLAGDERNSNVKDEDQYEEVFGGYFKIEDIKKYKIKKFSHRVDKKPNRQLINDTIYSTRVKDDKRYLINTLKNLYDKSNGDLKERMQKDPESLLMYHHDPQTFEKLKIVMSQYENEKNPLAKYFEETGQYLTKYAKHDNGPAIHKIKYYGNKLVEHLDITKNYHNPQNKVVQLSQKSFRFDVYQTDKGYKFISIAYLTLKNEKNYYAISQEKYDQLKSEKKISNNAVFIGSFYTSDIIEINNEKFRVIGVNSDKNNLIEVDRIDIRQKEFIELEEEKQVNYMNSDSYLKNNRIKVTIGRKTTNIEKFHTDILGNMYKSKRPKAPQLVFKKG